MFAGDPDLRIDGLLIWVHGRQFPDVADYWDGNWLAVRAIMQASGATITTEGSILMISDFQRFRNELEAMNSALEGTASLSSYEPNLKVTLTAGSLGHISGEVEITPDPLNQFHRFDIGLDQTYLPDLIRSCDTILGRFPVIGNPAD